MRKITRIISAAMLLMLFSGNVVGQTAYTYETEGFENTTAWGAGTTAISTTGTWTKDALNLQSSVVTAYTGSFSFLFTKSTVLTSPACNEGIGVISYMVYSTGSRTITVETLEGTTWTSVDAYVISASADKNAWKPRTISIKKATVMQVRIKTNSNGGVYLDDVLITKHQNQEITENTTLTPPITGDLIINAPYEITGSVKVAGNIVYKPTVTNKDIWQAIGLPFTPEFVGVYSGTNLYTATPNKDFYWQNCTSAATFEKASTTNIDAAIVKVPSNLSEQQVDGLCFVSPAGLTINSYVKTADSFTGYKLVANPFLYTKSPLDIIDADAYYVLNADGTVFEKVVDQQIAPFTSFIAYKGSLRSADEIRVISETTGINQNAQSSAVVKAASGSILIDGYSGSVQIYNLGGGVVFNALIDSQTSVAVPSGVYLVQLGAQAVKISVH